MTASEAVHTRAPTTQVVTQAEAAAMLRAVFNLFRHWNVSDAQARVLLGQPSPSTSMALREAKCLMASFT